jgi:cytochrome c peroxidase
LRHQFTDGPPTDPTNRVADDPAAQRLGQFLFFDPGLSIDGQQSCATCHKPESGFADSVALSESIGVMTRNTPSIINSAYNRWFYWDGRCDTLWCQATSPLEASDEHGTNRLAIAHYIHNDDELHEAYTGIFGTLPALGDANRFPANAMPVPDDPDDPLDVAWRTMSESDQEAATLVFINIAKAIAAYEGLLIQADAPFDDMLDALESGDLSGGDRVSQEAKAGAKLFVGDAQCWACHTGATFSNKEFHNLALPAVAGIDNESTGRYDGIRSLLDNPFNSKGQYSDRTEGASLKLDHLVVSPEQIGAFKTPGLRNLMTTAPYMHGGHFDNLTDVVTHYSDMDDPPLVGHREELLLPQMWTAEEIASVVAFLESLEGKPMDSKLLKQPASPF